MPSIRGRKRAVCATLAVCLLVYGYVHVSRSEIRQAASVNNDYEETVMPVNIHSESSRRNSIRVSRESLADSRSEIYDSKGDESYDDESDDERNGIQNSGINHEFASNVCIDNYLQQSAYPPTCLNLTDINPYILDYFRLKVNEPSDVFVNQHEFEYSINSNACGRFLKTFLVLVVHSAPKHLWKRKYIRRTFGSPGPYRGRNVALVFLVGQVRFRFLQEALVEEAEAHDDIVQGNFYDGYGNLTLKHVMAMHWLRNNCRTEYVLKLDDDTFVNPYRVVDYLLKVKPSGRTLLCKTLRGEKPMREADSKWYTPEWQYPFPVLPAFCLGFAYLTTPETWDAMYRASSAYRILAMDDVYVTALLAMAVNARKVDFSDILLHCSPDKRMYVPRLNAKAIFMDRANLCEEMPLRYWDYILKQNKGS